MKSYDILSYIFQVAIIHSILFLVYQMFLKNESFFKENRLFLILIPIVACSIPFLEISLHNNKVASSLKLEQLMDNFDEAINTQTQFGQITQDAKTIDVTTILFGVYLIGCMIYLCHILFQLSHIRKEIRNSKESIVKGNKVLINQHTDKAYNFLKWIIIGNQLTKEEKITTIIKHEQIHCQYHHSIDNLFAEFICMLLWFNPLIYRYKKAVRTNNEYFTDAEVIKQDGNSIAYMQLLANQQEQDITKQTIINSFNSITKKRIIMITKKTSSPFNRIKYLIGLPIVLLATLIFSGQTLNANQISPFVPEVFKYKLENQLPFAAQLVPDGLPIKKGAYRVTAKFGRTMNDIIKKKVPHSGIDLAAPKGTPVMSTGTGIIVFAGEKDKRKNLGKYITIKHSDGYQTGYWHLDEINVKEGQKVNKGDIIGTVGETGKANGPHLHYIITKNGKLVNPESICKY